jgi:outer membrane lipoprotein-sorting protein
MSAHPQAQQASPSRSHRRVGLRRGLRWAVPAVVAAAVAVFASGAMTATATPTLAPITPQQLIASLSSPAGTALSGTVVESASLGLPTLPDVGGGTPSTGLLGLLSGSHTARVWDSGASQQRIALLLGGFGEQDFYRNGQTVWEWDSTTRTATETVLTTRDTTPTPSTTPGDGPFTPAAAARQLLALVDPSTAVTTGTAAQMAGRPAYTLLLTPKQAASLVGSVRIYIDARYRIPLGVAVYARGASKPSLSIEFNAIHFATPPAAVFHFTPPPGATVKHSTVPATTGAHQRGHGTCHEPQLCGAHRGFRMDDRRRDVWRRRGFRRPGAGRGAAELVARRDRSLG